MKELKIKLFSFSELSDDAKEKAIEENREKESYYFWDNVEEEINALSDIAYTMGASKHVEYNFSLCSPSYVSFNFSKTMDEDFNKITGLRAYKYIYNNFIFPFIKGKYYVKGKYIDGKYYYKHKYSKAIKEFSSASGLYIDFVVYDVYLEYIDNIKNHVSFSVADFIEDIEDRLCKIILETAESYDSDKAWSERLLDDNSEIYTEEGEIYYK